MQPKSFFYCTGGNEPEGVIVLDPQWPASFSRGFFYGFHALVIGPRTNQFPQKGKKVIPKMPWKQFRMDAGCWYKPFSYLV